MRLRGDVDEQVIVLGDARVRQLPAGLSAQQFLEDLGRAPAPVLDRRAPADDMPAVSLLVLDALADDAETIYSMRNCGEMEPNGLALIGEHFLRKALRALLADGLIEVEQEVFEPTTIACSSAVHPRPPKPATRTCAATPTSRPQRDGRLGAQASQS